MKMKKFVYIPLLTTLAIAMFAGAGCDGEKAVVDPNPIRLVNGYENQLDLNSVMMYTALGQVSISTEKEYVSHGNASAKVTVMADPFYGVYDNYTPRLYQAMNIKKDGRDYTDFSDTAIVDLDVYNTSEKTERFGFSLYYSYYEGNSATQWFTLAPKAWTTVRYYVTRETIPTAKKDGKTVRTVEGVNYYFDRQKEELDFYLDGLRVYKTSEEIGVSPKTELKENEICSFDALWQVTSLKINGTVGRPSASLSRGFATDGGASLRMDMPQEAGGEYIYLIFNAKTYCPDYDFSKCTAEDSLCFDLYSPTENGFEGDFFMYLYSAGKTGYIFNKNFPLGAGNVYQIKIPVSEINGSSLADVENEACFQTFTEIRFGYHSKNAGGAKVLYMDNIRIEKGQ